MKSLIKMEQDLKILWAEIQLEKSDTCKEQKAKKYWSMYSLYRKQKSFLMEMGK